MSDNGKIDGDDYTWYDDFKWDKDYKESDNFKWDRKIEFNNEEVHLKHEVEGATDEYINEGCVKAMKHILEQLMEAYISDIEIGIQNGETIVDARIEKIENYLVKVITSSSSVIIPINHIVAISSNSLSKASLISEAEVKRAEDCESLELYIKEYFQKNIGKEYTIYTLGQDEFFRSINGTITKTGEGIIILNDNIAVMISKIIAVKGKDRC